jgi:regulator of sirC expression with transglutaminase-like and TPR domain
MRSIAPLELAASGGLMAYGVNFPDQFRRAAVAKSDKLLSSKAMVVNVAEKSGHDLGRQG